MVGCGIYVVWLVLVRLVVSGLVCLRVCWVIGGLVGFRVCLGAFTFYMGLVRRFVLEFVLLRVLWVDVAFWFGLRL